MVDIKDGPFDVGFMLAQVTYIFSDTLDDSGILPTCANTILLNLVIAYKLIKFCGKFRIVRICVEFCAEVERILWREISFETNDSLFEFLESLLLSANVVTQLFQYVCKRFDRFDTLC